MFQACALQLSKIPQVLLFDAPCDIACPAVCSDPVGMKWEGWGPGTLETAVPTCCLGLLMSELGGCACLQVPLSINQLSLKNTHSCFLLPWWLSGKEPTCQCRRGRFNHWIRKIPEEGNGNPLQYSCLGNPMDRGAWWAAYNPRGRKRVRHD